MNINDVLFSLKERVNGCLNGNHQDIILSIDLDSEDYDKLLVLWDNARLLDGNTYKFNLRFDTVGLFDERFPMILFPSSLEECEITNTETLEVIQLNKSDMNLSSKDLNTFTALFKLYLAQEQLFAGEIVQPFTIG